MKTHWNWVPFNETESAIGKELSDRLHLHPVIGCMLSRRGVTSVTEARKFLSPRFEELHDPFLMEGMRQAVERLNTAVGRKESILVYGDYDVDGTAAVTLVYKMLRLYGVSPSQLCYYIPDRNEDGYGISRQGVDYGHRKGVKLVIALDCGIKAVEEIRYAKELGIDFIICDHHTPDEQLPDAVAVLDPKRSDNTYPYTELSGCGIGFKLMQAFAIDNNLRQIRLNKVLELCAISIAADLVSVLGENRILAFLGLQQLNRSPSPALRGIIKSCKIPEGKRIDMSDIVFKIAPLLNASGRMFNGMQTVELLLTNDEALSEERCLSIIENNERRKTIDRIITREALTMVEDLNIDKDEKLIALYNPTWHKGVIGIVSARLAERYARPTIIMAGEDDNISGSARSSEIFDIYAAIERFKHLLVNFGGHPYAAGFTIKKENLPLFLDEIRDYANETIKMNHFVQKTDVDAELKLPQISRHFYHSMEKLAPFGPGNPQPVLLSGPLYDTGKSRLVGRQNQHLKLDLTDAPNRRYPYLGAMAFGKASDAIYIKEGKPFALYYTLEQTIHHGSKHLQLFVRDIHPLADIHP